MQDYIFHLKNAKKGEKAEKKVKVKKPSGTGGK